MTDQNLERWQALSERLANDLPSKTYRTATAQILSRVSQLGPLEEPEFEFRRAYRFLHYNEAARLLQVIDELLKAHEERKEQLQVRNNAWKYVVRAFDSWIVRARIFYLAAGIVEGTLRSRLDEHLTETFGAEWHGNEVAVPGTIWDQIAKGNEQQTLSTIQRILEESRSSETSPERNAATIEAIQAALKQAAGGQAALRGKTASEFCSQLPFSNLRTFFQTKRLWSNAGLGKIFKPWDGGLSPLRTEVDKVLGTIHEVRNEVAHYRPTGKLSFLEGLFAVAKLARSLEVDLQHVYGSIDSKLSTELSNLLEKHHRPALNTVRRKKPDCNSDKCPIGEPFDLLLNTAPIRWPAVEIIDEARLACLYHRVQIRAVEHKEDWPWRDLHA